MRANSLTSQVTGEKDNLGRILGDAYLHAPEAKYFCHWRYGKSSNR